MIRSNLNSDKYIQAGLDIGSDKICCAISEIDLKSDAIKLLGLGNSQATSINRGAITHRDNLIDETDLIMEILFSIKRAGATAIITYSAIDVAKKLNNKDVYQ